MITRGLKPILLAAAMSGAVLASSAHCCSGGHDARCYCRADDMPLPLLTRTSVTRLPRRTCSIRGQGSASACGGGASVAAVCAAGGVPGGVASGSAGGAGCAHSGRAAAIAAPRTNSLLVRFALMGKL